MSKIVVAIGGNALGSNPEEQKQIVKNTAKYLVDFIELGNDIVIVHGNGPQVGMINNGFAIAHKVDEKSPMVGFPECGAMSQGYIGYHLQNAIENELRKRKIQKDVVSLITQTLVDEHDKAFKNPTKPIGGFMGKEEALKMAESEHWDVVDDAGRGWRRVIASPVPIDVIEKDSIKTLIDKGTITISTGGGGIPVIEKDKELIGVDAVIDKDLAAAKIAELVNADKLIVLTGIDKVSINYKKPNEQWFDVMTVEQLEQYIADKQFAPGSMLPKIEAVISFVKSTNGKPAYIGNLEKANDVMSGKAATKIVLK